MPYGFPSGGELIQSIVASTLHKPTPDIFNYFGLKNEDVQRFGTDLHQSDCPSIDTFLRYRPEFLGVARLAIALRLAGFERDEALDQRDVNYDSGRVCWYHYLWEQMLADKGKFGENKVSFVTFNYDRSLERYFFRKLLGLHGYNNNDALEELYRIPFIHIHGSLGDERFEEFPYSKPKHTHNDIQKIAARLKLIGEDDLSNHPNFAAAVNLIEAAERVCFLGYGFHDLNNKGLRLEEIAERDRNRKRWFATRFHMTDAEFLRKVGKLYAQFKGVSPDRVGGQTDTSLEVLRNLRIIE
jgi:hypothetical protein